MLGYYHPSNNNKSYVLLWGSAAGLDEGFRVWGEASFSTNCHGESTRQVLEFVWRVSVQYVSYYHSLDFAPDTKILHDLTILYYSAIIPNVGY